jgi:hypothetical protein
MKKIFPLCYFISIIIIFPLSATADWINLTGAQSAPTIAEIYVEDDRVRLVFEIYVNDMDKFIDLLPDEWIRQAGVEPPPLEERIKGFSRETFQIIADDKEVLQAEMKLVEPRMRTDRPNPFAGARNPFTGQPIPGPPEDKRVLYAELAYPFRVRPSTLTIIPPLDERGRATVSIGFIFYHGGVPVVDYRYLSEPSIVELDWEDPWYSAFKNKQLKRNLQAGLRTFIYVEPYEVRHEILVRVKDVAAWVDLNLRGDQYIEIDEFDPLREKIGQFLLEQEKVLIDGKSYKPILDRIAFVESSMLRSRFIDQPERVPLNTAMIGVVITYLHEGMPQEVTAECTLFSDRIRQVPSSMVDPAGPFPYTLTPDDNVLKWTNFLKNYTIPTVDMVAVAGRHQGLAIPLGSVACLLLLLPVVWGISRRKKTARSIKPMLGLAVALVAAAVILVPLFQVSFGASRASRITEDDSRAILDSLLKNVYRAFDFRDEEDVYDKLAISVSGDLLEDIYLQHRKSMVVEQAGGAQAQVREIDIQKVTAEDSSEYDNALAFRAQWTALGTVGHWGHIHNRQNLYDAVLTLTPVDGSWKIIDLELLEEKRIDPFAKRQDAGVSR